MIYTTDKVHLLKLKQINKTVKQLNAIIIIITKTITTYSTKATTTTNTNKLEDISVGEILEFKKEPTTPSECETGKTVPETTGLYYSSKDEHDDTKIITRKSKQVFITLTKINLTSMLKIIEKIKYVIRDNEMELKIIMEEDKKEDSTAGQDRSKNDKNTIFELVFSKLTNLSFTKTENSKFENPLKTTDLKYFRESRNANCLIRTIEEIKLRKLIRMNNQEDR